MKVYLPWPHPGLSPNARLHWRAKSKLAAAQKAECYWIARFNVPVFPDSSIELDITFHPPNKRRRDLDNCIASNKSSFDGLADAWGVDDSRFVPTYRMGEPKQDGQVVVAIKSNRE